MELTQLLQKPCYSSAIAREIPELLTPKDWTLDELVVLFLAQHEINVQPVDANISPSRLSGALAGAVSPVLVLANTHLAHQKKAAALQEWTSWKQWAMAHVDFPAFKEQKRNELAGALLTQRETWAQPETQQRVAQLVADVDDALRSEAVQTAQMVGVLGALVAVAAGFLAVTDRLGTHQNDAPPAAVERSY